MKKTFLSISIFILFIIFSPVAFAATPELLFSDLTDGTVTGWNGGNQKGAAVSIWGYGFGSSRDSSYVTVGGVNLTDNSDYAEWGATTNPTTANGQERITFWLKPSMTLGNTTITVTTSEGTSIPIPFYTRNTGNIYFVSPSGNDSNTGLNDSNQMWATFYKVRLNVSQGDVVYFRDGLWTDEEAGTGNSSAILKLYTGAMPGYGYNNGQEHNSITLTSYPGEIARIGRGLDSDAHIFVRRYDDAGTDGLSYWTFSKFKINTYSDNFSWNASTDRNKDVKLRIIGNDMTSVDSTPTSGHLIDIFSNVTSMEINGNYMHGAGKINDSNPHTTKTKAIYFAGGGVSDGVDVGWNEIYRCNGHSQFFSHFRTDRLTNFQFHDNFIHDQGQQSLVICGGDPASNPQFQFCHGPIKVYNNIIADTIDSNKNNGDIKISAQANGNGGDFEVYNNTFYRTGALDTWVDDSFNYHHNLVIGADNTGKQYHNRSNSGYNNGTTATNHETGSYNVWFNSSAAVPTWSSNDVTIATKDQFVVANPTTYQDFRIKDASPLYGQNIGAKILGGQSLSNYRADVNNSGNIDSTDAMLTLRSFLGLDMSSTNWQISSSTGDANCDGSTNLTDANLILKYSLGLDVSTVGWCGN